MPHDPRSLTTGNRMCPHAARSISRPVLTEQTVNKQPEHGSDVSRCHGGYHIGRQYGVPHFQPRATVNIDNGTAKWQHGRVMPNVTATCNMRLAQGDIAKCDVRTSAYPGGPHAGMHLRARHGGRVRGVHASEGVSGRWVHHLLLVVSIGCVLSVQELVLGLHSELAFVRIALLGLLHRLCKHWLRVLSVQDLVLAGNIARMAVLALLHIPGTRYTGQHCY